MEQIEKKVKLKVSNLNISIITLNANYVKLYRKFRLALPIRQQTLSFHSAPYLISSASISYKFHNHKAFSFRIYWLD